MNEINFLQVNTPIDLSNCDQEPIHILAEVKNRTVDLENYQAALQRQIEQERLVMAIALRIRQSLHLDQILNTAVHEVREFMQAD